MATDIRLKKSSVAGRIPSTSNLEYGEIALNYQDGKLYYKDASNNVKAFLDSSNISTLVSNTIDSDYVTNRSSASFPILNQDSSLSHYQKISFTVTTKSGIVELQPQATYLDSGGLSKLANIGLATNALDSAQAISLIDSAYVTARVSAVDSAQVLQIVDSDYIKTVQYADNERLKFGAGTDLEIYHDGSKSIIKESGTGQLKVQTSRLAVTNAGGGTKLIEATEGGNVELYHNGTKTLETTDSGVLVSGGLSAKYLAPVAGATYTPPSGSGSDTSTTTSMAIHRGTSIDVGHNGFVRRLLTAASSGSIQIGHSSATGLFGNVQIYPGAGGSVFLHHKGANQKFRTTDTGVMVSGSLISDSATIAGLNYPTADGTNGQAIITDGNGTLTFGTVASGGGGGGTTGTVNQIKVNSYTGDSSTTAFTLSAAPASGSENSVVVTINGVTQHVNSYSLSGAVVTLDSAPITGDEIEMRVHDDVTANINLRDYKSYVYTPSTNTSAFTGADANGNTLTYDLGKVEVYLNGSRLVTGLDYTETSGSVLTLDSAIGSGDTLEIVSLAKAAISDGNFVRNVDSDFTTTTANQIIDTFAKASYRTTKYIAQIEHDSDNKYHSEEILLTHNGSAVAMTTYAQLLLDSNLGTFDADIVGTDVRLKFTPTYTNTSVKLKVIRTDA